MPFVYLYHISCGLRLSRGTKRAGRRRLRFLNSVAKLAGITSAKLAEQLANGSDAVKDSSTGGVERNGEVHRRNIGGQEGNETQ